MRRALVDLAGARTALWVALRKDAAVLGTFVVWRQEVRPFTDKQIALLENFAAQAVIAMENARLITETREALEQQTATAEVLQVINSSPGDLAPVFEAMLEKATILCEASFGLLFTYDGESVHAASLHNIPEGFAEFLRRGALKPGQQTTLSRAVRERKAFQIPDAADTDLYRSRDPFVVAAVESGGVRTVLSVPLIKDDALLGVIGIYRQEVRPFSDKQVSLLENFAAQAVIAMENARLIAETREALEQQTATAEVLQVINSSPGELKPVFDAMLEKAMRLCEAAFGVLWTYDGDRYYAAAVHGAPPAFVEFLREPRLPPYHPSSGLGRMWGGEDLAINNDMSAEEIYRSGDHCAERSSIWAVPAVQ